MASPISFTIELSRCWTTDRVMGSILADIIALLHETSRYNGSIAARKPDDLAARRARACKRFAPRKAVGRRKRREPR